MNYDNYQPDTFSEATECWKLEELYAALQKIKLQVDRKQLTSLEKTVLRGILSGNSTEKIANFLPGESSGSVINLTWRLYQYIQTLTATNTKDFNYKNIPHLLEAAGYKKSTFSEPIEESAEQIVRGGKQSLTTISLDTTIEEQAFSLSQSKIISTEQVSRQALSEPGQNHLMSKKQHSGFLHTLGNSELNINYELETQCAQKELMKDTSPVSSKSNSLRTSNYRSSLLTPNSELNIDTNTLSFVKADDFMQPISLWTKLGSMFMVGSVGVAIALSAFTPYNVTVKAQAKVRPTGELRIVEAETEGTVVEIHVNENQKVKKDDLLATIDNSRLETQKSKLESNIQQATLQLQQIQVQITAQENRIEAETRAINRTIASAMAELTLSRREYQDRNNTANAQVEEAIANLNSAQEELNQAQTELISLQADLKSAQASLNAAKSKQERYTFVAKSGALSQNQLEEAQLDVEQKEQQIIAKQAAIQRQNQEIARRKQAIAAAQARLNNSQVDLNPSDAEVVIAREKIEREKATGQATLATLKREREALIQQQIEIQQQQSRDERELQQIEKDLQQTFIKAPAEGILFHLNLRNSGQTVVSGEEIAQIAPSNTPLVVKALVPANEIGTVKTGQAVQLRVSACPYPDYGTLKGLVSKISPDALVPKNNDAATLVTAKAANNNQGKAFYEVEIKPDSLSLGKENHKCNLQLGMEGRADIISQEETVLKFLLRKARLITEL